MSRYDVPVGPAETATLAYPVHPDFTPAHFGGRRAWFRCPEPDCRRRLANRYRHDLRFKGRPCARLA